MCKPYDGRLSRTVTRRDPLGRCNVYYKPVSQRTGARRAQLAGRVFYSTFAQKEIHQLRSSKETLFRRGLDLSQSIFTESYKLIQKSRDTKNVINLLTEKYKNRPFFSDSETFYVEFIGQSFVSQKYILQLYSQKFHNKLSLFEIYSFFNKKALHTLKSEVSHAENIKKNVNRVEQTDKKKSKQKKTKI